MKKRMPQQASDAARYQLLVDAVTDHAIYMLDPKGFVTSWNPGAERLKGYTALGIIGQHFSCFLSDDDRAVGLAERALQEAAANGRHESESWYVRKDGSRFWAWTLINAIRDHAGTLIGFAAITRDLTERREAQQALIDSERRFRSLVEGVVDHAIYLLDANGFVTNWNPGAERIHGYSATEIVGSHFSRFYTDDERSAGLPTTVLETAARRGKYETEGWRVRKDGSRFWVSVVIDALRGENGEITGFAKITRDITERREAQAALQKAEQQLAHAQKVEALGQLTGGVAHDFNNLLMIVTGHVGTLRKLVADNPKGMRAVEAIELAARRGATLTRQLLTFSRRQHLKPVNVSLNDCVETCRAMLASAAGSTIKLDIVIPSETWPVLVDVSELELALVNLAVNARDAMPQGGVVTISAANVHCSGREPGPPLEGEFVAISITDSGVGIPAEVVPRIFDPFFTTKEIGKGTGLGLSQVHGFAHQSGGTITVDSMVGRGTAITIFLPRTQAGLGPPARQDLSGADALAKGSVLVVEDNPEVASVSTSVLEELGYEVQTVSDAGSALAALDGGGTYDLVFSDVVMAGRMDGLALARAIREKRPGLPVLLATGYSKAVEAANGEFPVLRKPYQIDELSRAAAQLISEAQRRPAAP